MGLLGLGVGIGVGVGLGLGQQNRDPKMNQYYPIKNAGRIRNEEYRSGPTFHTRHNKIKQDKDKDKKDKDITR